MAATPAAPAATGGAATPATPSPSADKGAAMKEDKAACQDHQEIHQGQQEDRQEEQQGTKKTDATKS